jgi:cation transporter-like permease
MGVPRALYVEWVGSNIDSKVEHPVDHSLMELAPTTVASVHQAATTTATHLTISAASGDILSNSKAMALLLPGLGGVLLIAIGWIWTVRKLKEGIGEALVFQVGLIVVGVVIVLSVGIAAAVTDWAVDEGLVKREYVTGDEWGS